MFHIECGLFMLLLEALVELVVLLGLTTLLLRLLLQRSNQLVIVCK